MLLTSLYSGDGKKMLVSAGVRGGRTRSALPRMRGVYALARHDLYELAAGRTYS